MGYALCMGQCYGCKKTFSFNPVKVPSLTIEGTKEPFCKDCIDKANVERVKLGKEPLTYSPEAYNACNENEL